MKKINLTNILLIILIFIISMGIFSKHSLNVDLDLSENKNNTIAVSGSAEKTVVPNISKISFFVTRRNKDQTEAANYVNKKTKKIIKILKKEGVKEKDIKTNRYSVYPQYNWEEGKRTFVDYRVRQNVQITIRDFEKISKILSIIVEQKVDSVDGPNMSVENIEKIRQSLKEEAISDAKEKAKELAGQLNIKLEKIIGFSEKNNNRNYYPQYKMAYAEADMAPGRVSEPVIAPGEEKITEKVSIIFKIEN